MTQSLPLRAIGIETDDADALAAAQPERRRRFDQVGRGPFRATLHEVAWGTAALQTERWSCGVRLRCDRPAGYVTFGVLQAHGDARCCGVVLPRPALLRIVGPWELSSSGPVDMVAFAVDEGLLEGVAHRLAGGEAPSVSAGNRCGPAPNGPVAEELLRLLRTIRSMPPEAGALTAAQDDLLHLAAALGSPEALLAMKRLETPSRRRRAVRRIEEYLDADPSGSLTVATLCGLAGVSERTLEYAFREHLGMTPVRFLKLRRLDRIRRELLDPAGGPAGVAGIAGRAGIYDLGRFAGDYRRLFGELPSETLRRRPRA